MFNKIFKAVNGLICGVLILQLIGCGTIMYPERKGQKAGKIDAGVAVLDGIGLLFFLIPGIIAFAIDFNNGTIYLPGTSSSSLEIENMKQVKFDPKHSSLLAIERIIKEETGTSIKLDQFDMSITKLESTDDIIVQFKQILPAMQDERIVFNR